MERERRKVDYVNGKIQLLKSNGNGGWHQFGESKSQKGFYDILLREGIGNFQVTDEAWEKLHLYMMDKEDITKYLL